MAQIYRDAPETAWNTERSGIVIAVQQIYSGADLNMRFMQGGRTAVRPYPVAEDTYSWYFFMKILRKQPFQFVA